MLDLSGLDIWASKGAAFGLPLLYMPPQESPEGVVVELNSLAGLPDPTRTTPTEAGLDGVNEVEITVADGITLVAWHAPAKDDKPTILYFHGNAANAANRASKIETMRESGFGIFYLNNRGYGGSGGKPTEEDNVADAIAAYDHLTGLGVPADSIVAFGESLGSGQALRLATERPVAAVVLEALDSSGDDSLREELATGCRSRRYGCILRGDRATR